MSYLKQRRRFYIALIIMLILDIELVWAIKIVCGLNFFIENSPSIFFCLFFGAIIAHGIQTDEMFSGMLGDLERNTLFEQILFDIVFTPICWPVLAIVSIFMLGGILVMLVSLVFCVLFVWKVPDD